MCPFVLFSPAAHARIYIYIPDHQQEEKRSLALINIPTITWYNILHTRTRSSGNVRASVLLDNCSGWHYICFLSLFNRRSFNDLKNFRFVISLRRSGFFSQRSLVGARATFKTKIIKIWTFFFLIIIIIIFGGKNVTDEKKVNHQEEKKSCKNSKLS